jgi:nucleoside phosphorylase
MANGIQQADVCIICALEKEANAVEHVVSEHCQTAFATGTTKNGRLVYRYTTITNNKHEQLTLLLHCQTRPGPVSTALDLRLLLQTFQPRFVAMSGICAGDKRYLNLGDLVVAEYAYLFEEGKVTRDQQGTLIHQPEGITYGPAEHILQYVRIFGAWKTPVLTLKKRLFDTDELPQRVMALMASGMSVRGDDPFEGLQQHHRKAWAVDMEAATFYFALRAFPGIDGLVVKGVVDYADPYKDDAFHKFATRASAIYLLTFIQEYISVDTPLPPPTQEGYSLKQWLAIGNEHNNARRYTEALAAFEKAIRIDPNVGLVYQSMGYALSKLQRYEEASSAFEHAVRLDPMLPLRISAWAILLKSLADLARHKMSRAAK